MIDRSLHGVVRSGSCPCFRLTTFNPFTVCFQDSWKSIITFLVAYKFLIQSSVVVSSTLSCHFWLQKNSMATAKTKMATAKMPNSRLQNGSPQIYGWLRPLLTPNSSNTVAWSVPLGIGDRHTGSVLLRYFWTDKGRRVNIRSLHA